MRAALPVRLRITRCCCARKRPAFSLRPSATPRPNVSRTHPDARPWSQAMMEQIDYHSGFGNEFATEAIAGGLPVGQNSPQHHKLGLYAEVVSGTAFTVSRRENRRS